MWISAASSGNPPQPKLIIFFKIAFTHLLHSEAFKLNMLITVDVILFGWFILYNGKKIHKTSKHTMSSQHKTTGIMLSSSSTCISWLCVLAPCWEKVFLEQCWMRRLYERLPSAPVEMEWIILNSMSCRFSGSFSLSWVSERELITKVSYLKPKILLAGAMSLAWDVFLEVLCQHKC